MPFGAHAVPGNSMIKAVFDANILVSAFLSRDNPEGVSSELLRFVVAGAIDLHLQSQSSTRRFVFC
jgi:predicted nucleic acid-binding protein